MKPLQSTALSSLMFPLALSLSFLACTSKPDFPAESRQAALQLATDCDDLLERIREDARVKIELDVEDQKKSFDQQLLGGLVAPLSFASSDEADGGGITPQSGDPGRDFAVDAAPDEFSETNTQVEDVDEADIVKTDGERIYLLHGTSLYLFDSWPADTTAILGSAAVTGTPYELFVEGGKAVVFSMVAPSDIPRSPGRGRPSNCGYEYDCYADYFTQISVYDVSGELPQLERELLVEGQYVSGRRHGSTVRAVVTNGFAGLSGMKIYAAYDFAGRLKSKGQFLADLEQWRDDMHALIDSSDLSLWIPRQFERRDGELTQLPSACAGYWVPEAGSVGDGATQVVSFDLESLDVPPQTAAVLGNATTVYASHDTLVLGHPNYAWTFQQAERNRTALHSFALSDGEATYQASGFVPGYLLNQFSLDEQEGILRVSTSEDVVINGDSWEVETTNRVYTLGVRGKDLEILGKTEPFGDAGETIYATRFLGDRAYVVTFRQMDPLVAIDLTDPSHPRVLGQLHIPGFSEYIHPLPNHHLLTIGQDETGGVALQLFDVNDPTEPRLVHKRPFGSGESEAGWNHKAFTFMQDHFGEDQSLLMFPMTSYDGAYTSQLHVLSVSTKDGLEELGAIEHTEFGPCADPSSDATGCSYDNSGEMRRGLEIGGDAGDFIYAISRGGITVHDLADLSATLRSIPLPAPGLAPY